jgi:hypothetical protein
MSSNQGRESIDLTVDEIAEIPTDELTYLVSQFHIITLQMYKELCHRRVAATCISELETLLSRGDGQE